MTIEQLEKASASYYAGQPLITDAEFDSAVAELRRNDPDNYFLKRIGAPVPGKEKVQHKIMMGSLDNANNENELRLWLPDTHEVICISHKLDGSSLELIYQNGSFVQAITRGDGEVGEDVTKNVLKSGNVPLSIHPSITSVRCECLIHKDDWYEHFKGDANPRNSAAGTLRRHDGHNAKYLQFYAFDALIDSDYACLEILEATESESELLGMLGEWFYTPDYAFRIMSDNIIKWCQATESVRDNLQYEIDGVVVKIDNRLKSRMLGHKDNRPRGQIAFKFTPRGGETVLNNVVWQVGHTGSLNPVGEVSPVGVGGTTIRRVTLCNPDEITRLGISIGDTVEVVRAGDSIPKLSKLIGKGKSRRPIFIPNECPECESKTQIDGARLFCTNNQCSGRTMGRVMTWIKKRNILNLGIGVVKAANIVSILHLYEMGLDEWANIQVGNGVFGHKRAKKVMEALEKSKSVSLSEFIGSVGIKGVGRSLASDLCDYFSDEPTSQLTLSDIFLILPEDIARLNGFGQTRAYDFRNWLLEHRVEINKLASIMNFENQPDTKCEGGVFDGEIICFTGKSPKPRHEMSQLAESAGASVCSSVSANTTVLVIADPDSESSKAVKARKMGIKLMSPGDFLSKVGV